MGPEELRRVISQRQARSSARVRTGPPSNVRLGPFTSAVVAGSRWVSGDEFPAWQVWADEVEKVLAFGLSQRQFERYLPELHGGHSQRDSALMELRVAFYFHRNDFPIKEWRPVGNSGRESWHRTLHERTIMRTQEGGARLNAKQRTLL